MAEQMKMLQATYSNKTAQKPRKTYIGEDEIHQLINYEMQSSKCIENSEQHQVTWCIGCIAAVRPGSLCLSKFGRNKPLCWEDLTFTRGDEPGMFNVKLVFKDLNIKAAGSAGNRGREPHGLEVNFISLKDAEELFLSTPHRLLVIALRRHLIKGIETLDELINYPFHQIKIKEEHLTDPIFYASVPKGQQLNPPHPLKAAALSKYLANQGLALGYNKGILFYSLRRKARLDLVHRIGLKNARTIMGHAPELRTLERYYLSLGPTIDLTATMSERPVEAGGHSTELVRQSAPLAINRPDEDTIKRTRGAALEAYTSMLICIKPNSPCDSTPAVLKAYQKNIWCRGQVGALKASEFAKSILSRAQDALSGPDISAIDADEDEDDAAKGQELNDDLELDLEDEAAREGTRSLNMSVDQSDCLFVQQDEPDEYAQPSREEVLLSFKEIARTFMDTILTNALSISIEFKSTGRTCELCEEDNTASEESKRKLWFSGMSLKRHQEGTYHSRRSRWDRMQKLRVARDPNRGWVCPYCPESAQKDHESLSHLVRHILSTGQRRRESILADVYMLLHERLKAEDGWYDDDFQGDVSNERKRSREREARRSLGSMGLTFAEMSQYTTPEPHPDFPGLLQRGDFGLYDMPTQYQGFLKPDANYSAGESTPVHFRDMFMTVPTPQAQVDHAMNFRFKKILETKSSPIYFERRTQEQTRPGEAETGPEDPPNN
ncbi:hypothetical protein IWX90DRAFT_496155 [Phyllosticta citrichinensis]|uniref:Uncharacterized protein n=1 Tax=Phyllosticta citrichinensis TaxID=1130410 RepID=A0ABR1XFA2_9PEZI